MSFNNTPTRDIEIELKKMEIDHNNIKDRLLSLWNELIEIEKKYEMGKNELKKRGVNHD